MLYECTWEEGTGHLISSYITGGLVTSSVLTLSREIIQLRDVEHF